MAVKLKALKQDLKAWNKEVFGNVPIKKLAALAQLGFWDLRKGKGLSQRREGRLRGGWWKISKNGQQ